MEPTALTHGMRIKFIREGNLMRSHKIYSNGITMCRVVIDTESMIFTFVDPATNEILYTSTKDISNLEVLQRHVKKALRSFLGIKFTKEKRKVKSNV